MLGPVVDFVVDDGAGGDPTSSSGAQARIVTCSGAGPSGSIREARSGASVQDVSSLPVPNAQQIWPLHSGDHASKHSVGLLVAFATSTAYLQFDANGDLVDATERLAAAVQTCLCQPLRQRRCSPTIMDRCYSASLEQKLRS